MNLKSFMSRAGNIFIISSSVFCLSILLLKILNAPLFDWNGRRLVGPIAMAYGKNIFLPPEKNILISGVNGPYYFLPYLFASLSKEPNTATMIGVLGTILVTLLPVFFILYFLSIRLQKINNILLTGTFLCFIFYSFQSKALNLSLYIIHADGAAICFSALSLLFAYFFIENKKDKYLYLSGYFSSCSVLSKITFLPILFAVPFYLSLTFGKKYYFKIFSAFFVTMFLNFTLVGSLFGFKTILFNIYPFQDNFTNNIGETGNYTRTYLAKIKTLFSAFVELFEQYLFPVCILSFFAVRNFIDKKYKYFIFPLFISLLMIPTALAGRAHSGGDYNTQSPFVYFLILSFTIFILENIKIAKQSYSYLAMTLSLILLDILSIKTTYSLLWPLKQLKNNSQTQAFQIAKIKPNEIYFPDYPLANLIAEKKVYHSGLALAEMTNSTYRLPLENLMRYFPSELKYVAFDREPYQDLMIYLSQYNKRTTLAELPGWIVLEKNN